MLLFVTSCRTPQSSQWTPKRVSTLAYEILRINKLDPKDFDPPHFIYVPAKHFWMITFWGPAPDTEVWIFIDETTNEVRSNQGFVSLRSK